MPSPFATSFATILGGQEQAAGASQYAQAQAALERAKLAIEERRLQTASKQILQMPDGTYKIVDLSDPNVVAGGTIGTPIDYGARLKSMRDSAPDYLKPLINSAINSSDTDFQKSVATGALTAMEKRPTGLGAKLSPMYARAMADNNLTDESQVTAPMLTEAYQKINKENSALIAGRTPPQIVQVQDYDAQGRPITRPELVNKRGGTATSVTTPSGAPVVGKKISGTEAKTLATVQSIIPQLAGLRAKLVAIGPDRWNRTAALRGIDYEKAKRFDILPADPELAQLVSQLIQVETNAKAALGAASGTRAYTFIKDSSGHIPTAYGDYNSILTNIDTLSGSDGPYQSLLGAYELGKPASSSPGKDTLGLPRDAIDLGGGRYYSPTMRKTYEATP